MINIIFIYYYFIFLLSFLQDHFKWWSWNAIYLNISFYSIFCHILIFIIFNAIINYLIIYLVVQEKKPLYKNMYDQWVWGKKVLNSICSFKFLNKERKREREMGNKQNTGHIVRNLVTHLMLLFINWYKYLYFEILNNLPFHLDF